MRTWSGSCRGETFFDVPGRRRSRNRWTQASSSSSPGGQPSTTQPIAGPWLSPQVVSRNRWPKLLMLIRCPPPNDRITSTKPGKLVAIISRLVDLDRLLRGKPKRQEGHGDAMVALRGDARPAAHLAPPENAQGIAVGDRHYPACRQAGDDCAKPVAFLDPQLGQALRSRSRRRRRRRRSARAGISSIIAGICSARTWQGCKAE